MNATSITQLSVSACFYKIRHIPCLSSQRQPPLNNLLPDRQPRKLTCCDRRNGQSTPSLSPVAGLPGHRMSPLSARCEKHLRRRHCHRSNRCGAAFYLESAFWDGIAGVSSSYSETLGRKKGPDQTKYLRVLKLKSDGRSSPVSNRIRIEC